MNMVIEAKKMLEEQGCKAELIDVAIKEYLNQNSAEVKNVELTKEILAINEEIKDIKKESSEFVETISLLLEYIVRIDLSGEEGKEKFKKLQHQAQHKLTIINLMKRLM